MNESIKPLISCRLYNSERNMLGFNGSIIAFFITKFKYLIKKKHHSYKIFVIFILALDQLYDQLRELSDMISFLRGSPSQ